MNVQIEIGDEPREAIGVFDLDVRAIPKGEIELVVSWIVPERRGEEAFRAQFPHGECGAVHADRRVHGLRKEGAYFPAIVSLVRP